MKKLSAEEFIEKANTIHGNKYDYSRVTYVNYSTTVEICCSHHGAFFQSPRDHLSGRGCKLCKYAKLAKQYSHSTEQFIEKAKSIHGDKYDYSATNYINAKTKVSIFCNKHNGYFNQTPSDHLQGKGCLKCRSSYKLPFHLFVIKANAAHKNKYSYNENSYLSTKEYTEITCNKHGIYTQTPDNHMQGHGCPKCAIGKHQSSGELEIAGILNSFGLTIRQNDRTTIKSPTTNRFLELDIYIQDIKIAIEYGAEYFHSDSAREELKTKSCHDLGIKLYRIWHHEWKKLTSLEKHNLLQSIINDKY